MHRFNGWLESADNCELGVRMRSMGLSFTLLILPMPNGLTTQSIVSTGLVLLSATPCMHTSCHELTIGICHRYRGPTTKLYYGVQALSVHPFILQV